MVFRSVLFWSVEPRKSLEPQRVLGFLLFCTIWYPPQKPTQKPTRLHFIHTSISQGDQAFRDDITQATVFEPTPVILLTGTTIFYIIILKKGVDVWTFKTFSLFGAS